MLSRVLRSVGFRKVLVIFLVGLVLRGVLNYVYDINVVKEYSNLISLTYFGFMVGFSGFVYELPSISFSVSDFKSIRETIKVVVSNYFLVNDKDKITMGVGGDIFKNTLDNKKGGNNLFYNSEEESKHKYKSTRSVRSTKSTSKSSAGVEGLYNGRKTIGRIPAGVRGLYEQSDKRYGYDNSKTTSVSSRVSRVPAYPTIDRVSMNQYDPNLSRSGAIRVECENVSMPSDESCVIYMTQDGAGRVVNNPNFKGRVNNNLVSRFSSTTSGFSSQGSESKTGESYYRGTAPTQPVYGERAPSNYSKSGTIQVGLEEYPNTHYPPRAPRVSNYSTPETMSPLFPLTDRNSSRSTVGSSVHRVSNDSTPETKGFSSRNSSRYTMVSGTPPTELG